MGIIFISQSLTGQSQFQSLRYNEDFSHYRDDTTGNWYTKFKYRELNASGSAFVTQGGEVRYQYQHFTNEDWGDVPVKSYNSFYTRFLYHTDWHLGRHFRLFAQLNSTFASGRVTPKRAIDENMLDVQQVFFDLMSSSGLVFRIGRQEFLYGSQRLIAVREGPNNRQSFDAVKLFWRKDKMQFDIFYSHPVRVQQGIFDDSFNNSEKLWATYAVISKVPKIRNIDIYYIGFYNNDKRYAAGSGKELRHSLGIRMWEKSQPWSYDFEALYQFGEWGHRSISAYTASLDVTYKFVSARWQPSINLKTEVISGDNDNDDDVLNTFNPLFPRGAYFGLAALIGPANLLDVHPALSFRPGKKIAVNADYDIFWRYSIDDGLYGPNTAMILGNNSDNRFIGHQVGFSVEYEPNSFLTVTPELMWFFPGHYLDDVSPGRQVFFAALTVQFKF